MSPLAIVPLYAAALGVLFIVLSLRVLLARRKLDVGFGTAGNADLERRIRIQANFAEYVPLALLLLAFAEVRGAPAPWLHLLCAGLVVGRLAHAIGLSREATDMFGRVAGMTGSMVALLGAAVLLVVSGAR